MLRCTTNNELLEICQVYDKLKSSHIIISCLFTRYIFTGQIKWSSLLPQEEECNQTAQHWHKKALPDTIDRCTKQWNVTVFIPAKAVIIPADVPHCVLHGSDELNHRQLPPLLYWSDTVLRSLQWRLTPSLITTESICRWLFSFYPLCLCSSLSVPALRLLWGVLIFHPTSNQHIDGLMGRPAGGRLEHAGQAVVLFQAAD